MKRFLSPDDVKINYSSWVFFKDLLHFIKPYRWRFTLASLLRLMGDIAWLYPAYGFAVIINFFSNYSLGDPLSPVWNVLFLWAGVTVIRYFSQFSCRRIGFEVSQRIVLDATRKGISHLFRLDMAWHEKENSGNKLKRIQNGSQGIDVILRLWINSLIEVGVNFIGTIIIIYQFNQLVAGMIAVFLVTFLIISHVFTKRAASAAYLSGVEEEKINGLLTEAISNIRTVKVMDMGRSLKEVITKAMDELIEKVIVRIFRFQIRSNILAIWGWVFKLSALVFVIYGIAEGRYEVGFLVLFNGYFNEIWQSVRELSDASQDIVVAKYGIARMNETLSEKVTIDDETNKVEFPENWKEIEIRNISFAYGKKRVLSNVSFDVRRGEKVGIVGLSGAGKSTIFKLLLKEYETEKGDIKIEGVSIKSISKSSYLKNVSVVLQDTEVFNFSLKENITIVNPEAAKKKHLFERAIEVAHVSDFVHKLPNGADTLIGEKGVKLSGGERQRLGIARAVFKNPQILLLDEATSHLDLESEEKIKESLHEFFGNVTAIVIAHRLTTIKEMDKIVLFEEGKILEMGSFEELHAKKGRFHELWEKQKL